MLNKAMMLCAGGKKNPIIKFRIANNSNMDMLNISIAARILGWVSETESVDIWLTPNRVVDTLLIGDSEEVTFNLPFPSIYKLVNFRIFTDNDGAIQYRDRNGNVYESYMIISDDVGLEGDGWRVVSMNTYQTTTYPPSDFYIEYKEFVPD